MTVKIGKCIACNTQGRLGGEKGDACIDCLTGPSRGEKWLELARRVRNVPGFALKCYNGMKTVERKLHFIEKFGLPEGGEDPRPDAKVYKFPTRL